MLPLYINVWKVLVHFHYYSEIPEWIFYKEKKYTELTILEVQWHSTVITSALVRTSWQTASHRQGMCKRKRAHGKQEARERGGTNFPLFIATHSQGQPGVPKKTTSIHSESVPLVT
jgi:hypothetical protein